MSPAAREEAGRLRQMYDKVILVVILVVLLISTLFLLFQTGRMKARLMQDIGEQLPMQPRQVRPLDLEAFARAQESLAHPFQMVSRPGRLLTSELRVSCVECRKPIVFDATRCPFCGAVQPEIVDPKKIDSDGDGIPDWWETKYGLNPLDLADAQNDLDDDGFSNLEEFLAGSDPKDPADAPAPVAKLRLRRVTTEPFFLRFQGTATLGDGSVRYQLNLRTLERTYFVQLGDEIEGFKVLDYRADTPQGPVVVLQQGEKKINLYRGQAIQQQELTAHLVFLIDRSTIRARIGDEITLKDHVYKVVDIKRNNVLIRDVKANKETLVPPLSAGDLAPVPTGGRTSAPEPSLTDTLPES